MLGQEVVFRNPMMNRHFVICQPRLGHKLADRQERAQGENRINRGLKQVPALFFRSSQQRVRESFSLIHNLIFDGDSGMTFIVRPLLGFYPPLISPPPCCVSRS
jgi:hypothetical protein